MIKKGIILAGGKGTRMSPLTKAVNKQLLPIYDKPLIFYPLSILMLANIRDILIIVNPGQLENFKNLLGDGTQWGISIEYAIQEKPEGLAQAFLIAEKFINNNPSALILGDNLYHGNDLTPQLIKANNNEEGATIFVYPVSDPQRYGVAEFDNNKKVINLDIKNFKLNDKNYNYEKIDLNKLGTIKSKIDNIFKKYKNINSVINCSLLSP